MTDSVECVVIGAGVVGLAVARALALAGRELVVIEAAEAIGTATSSRNSEVIHAGIYYPSNSVKANLCLSGKQALYGYCQAKGIPHRRIGKIIVATQKAEIDSLEKYAAQAAANGVDDLRWLSQSELEQREPALRAVRGLLSPSTGIIDSHAFMLALQGDLEAGGGVLALNSEVEAVRVTDKGFILSVGEERLACRYLINSAGLLAPRLARRIEGLAEDLIPQAFFAKGHYYSLSGPSPFNQLIYPQAGGGGLGVHVTLDMGGQARFGPDVRWIDGINYDFDDSHREDFIAAIRRYYPGLEESRLQPSYTGIRPKISGPGEPAADFHIQGPDEHGIAGLVNLFGIESPGLTASLAVGDELRKILSI